MTTFCYTTTSNEATVTDMEAVEELCSEYYFTVEPTVEDETISFFADSKPNSAFDVYETPDQMNSVVEEFLNRLAEYLNEPFEVKCVEVQGEGQPEAWKWQVTSEGEVTEVRL